MVAGLVACSTPASDTRVSEVSVLTNNANCAYYEKAGKAVWLNNEDDLTAIWKQTQAQMLGLSTAEIPQVNFTGESVVAVFMGQRSTAGYQLAMAPQALSVKDGIASLKLHYLSPADDAIRAQVITSPCVLIKLETGAFTQLRIVDQKDRVQHELAVF